MVRDPLAVLLRLRGVALDAERRALADRLREAAAAAARAATIEAEAAREAAAVSGRPADRPSPCGTSSPGDDLADAYAAWMRRAQRERQAAAEALRTATAAEAEARQSMNTARAAVRVLEAMQAHAAEARRRAAERGEQRVLDEVAARAGGMPGESWSG